MALKSPMLCASIYVSGSCTIRMGGSVTGLFTLTIPEGLFWCDPLVFPYPPLITPNASLLEAFSYFQYALDAAVGTSPVCSYLAVAPSGEPNQTAYVATITDVGQTLTIYPGDSNTSDEGRRFLAFLGFHGRVAMPASGGTIQGNGYAAVWRPSRYESGDIDEKRRGLMATAEMGGGNTATTDLGADVRGRVVTFAGLSGSCVKQRGPVVDLTCCPFESVLHPWSGRGNLIRYYEDVGAVSFSVLTSAPLAATGATMSVPASAGFTSKKLCVDGEWLATGTAPTGTTLNIYRDNRVAEAHPYGSPISSAYVGTYVLAASGGNVDARAFAPERRGGENQDRWDMQVALTRAVWS